MTGTGTGTVVGTSHDARVATSGGAHTLVTGWMCLVSEAVDAVSSRAAGSSSNGCVLQGEGHVEFYPGNFTEYETDRRRRGVEAPMQGQG